MISKLIKFLTPPPNWKLPVILITGVFFGLVFFTLHISKATSYLSEDPRACVNCHVMSPQYATWERSSHGKNTTCSDCHVPQDNVVRKYYFKASDGLRHATMFTLRMEPQVIQIKDAGREVVQENCIRCHANYLHPVSLRAINAKAIYEGHEQVCWDCHREVPHGRVNSLSSTPYARVPQLSPAAPEWITKFVSEKE